MDSNKASNLRRVFSTTSAGNHFHHCVDNDAEIAKWTGCCRSTHQPCFSRRNSWTVFINDDGRVKQLENDAIRFEPNSDLFVKTRRGSSPQVCSDRHLSNQLLASGLHKQSSPNSQQQQKKLPQTQHRRSCSLYHRSSRCLATSHRMSNYSNDGVNQSNCTSSRCSRVHLEGCKTPCRDSAYSSDGEIELTLLSNTSQSTMPLLPKASGGAERSCFLRRGSSLVDRKYVPPEQLLPQLSDQNKALSTPMLLKEKVRSLKEKIRKHAVQSSANGDDWPPPRAIFGERYTNVSLPAPAPSELVLSKGYLSAASSSCTANSTQQAHAHSKGSSSRSGRIQNGARERRRSQSMNCKRTANTKRSGLGDIVVSDSDLRAIIKSVQAHSSHMNEISKEPTKPSTTQQSKMRFIRKQVSFDDKECIIRSDARKVSIIQEEIDHSTLDFLVKSESALNANTSHDAIKFTSRRQLVAPAIELSTNQARETVIVHVSNPQKNDEVIVEIDPACEVDAKSDVNKETSPREIEFDENGQTWDIYGAEFDHVLLGDAIERHLATTFKRRSLQLENQPIKHESVIFDNDEQSDGFVSNTRCSQLLRYFLCLKKSHKIGFEPINRNRQDETAV